MSSFTVLSNLAAQTRAVHAQSKVQTQFGRRWIHNALRRQAIMMPALSPFATEGTITRWRVKEGDSFVPGDVLLQIENEAGMVDVEACSPGIMGKILTPDGTDHVPVEAVIAIVARDKTELAAIQTQSLAPTPPPFISTPGPPSTSVSPRHTEFSKPPLMPPRTPRTPSLYEMHSMGYGHRSIHVGGPRGSANRPSTPSLDLPPCPSPRTREDAAVLATPAPSQTPATASYSYPINSAVDDTQMDGAVLRRMIVANLSAARATSEVEDFV
ncbi:single hybrid motif-containing protein [Coprinopsis marcescibilis]|uniref:Single hybrid motif-containing protein n=1 Tax=Coprinopsis marcescibilis TaxID=230819 RepID=A0A5C3L479_COPMA|nr:single hybrid motif-containing protein [Coprinopsis marcescibilis]